MGRLTWLNRGSKKYSYFSGHQHKNYLSWILPVIVSIFLVTVCHVTLVQADEPTTSELEQYLQANELIVGEETVGKFRQIYYEYNGEKFFITDENANFRDPEVSGEFITWVRTVDGQGQIFRHNILTGQTLQLTTYSTNQNPYIEGGQVVWEKWMGDRWHVELFDGSAVVQASSGESSVRPLIHDNQVIYVQNDVFGSGLWGIFSYDITSAETTILQYGDAEEAWPHVVEGVVEYNFPSDSLVDVF